MTSSKEQALTLEIANELVIVDDSLCRRGMTQPAGTVMTTRTGHKYRMVSTRYFGKSLFFLAHRVVYLIHHGNWPENHIDHLDGNGLNNAPDNLRDATNQENMRNAKLYKTNKSGTTGVRWRKDISKWTARICVDGKNLNLGYFTEKEDAIEARKAAEREHGFHENHGRTTGRWI